MRNRAFTLVELLVSLTIVATLAAMVIGTGMKAGRESSLAVSANNIHQLCLGGTAYLADHKQEFWPYRANDPTNPLGVTWWFGFEPQESFFLPEGSRIIKPELGPLGGYIPSGFRPDPSFQLSGKPFKPKYQFGYIGVGYNVLLGGGWTGVDKRANALFLPKPGEIVVFATSAQVNTFQRPATPRNPMIEEFYGLDEREVTVHFRQGNFAMVGFANGSAGFLPMDESTRDSRAPLANVGRFAPVGSKKFLLPTGG